MAKTSTNISIDADIKVKAQELFADFGLDLSTAINIFLRQAVRENAIPFNISRDVPNDDTLEAIKEIEEFKRNPDAYKRYSSFSELLDEVNEDA
ncbi:MAG: type II toxin-antitoxin system RelB/DinJ family antitoxin [Clostridia bacterium]|nr:type II toxin-antitoxin system RelB/DinJ family antitoxin [Clostridia bacterium]